MKKLTLSICLTPVFFTLPFLSYAQIQPVTKWIFQVGSSVSFATKAIANNDAGIGIIGRAEKNIYKNYSIGVETGFNYFIGDKSYSMYGKNKAYTIPLLAEMKVYFLSQFYIVPRLGALYFLLNDQSTGHIQFAYGLAGGMNLPKKNNRINIQGGYTAFRHDHVQRGYATLAVAVIIN
jgi:hypothetical protein